MGSRLKGAQKARDSSPSQPRTPPTHAVSNRKGWLALSWLSCLPQAQESMAGEPCSEREEVTSYDSNQGLQNLEQPETYGKNSLLREDRSTQETGHPEEAKARGLGQLPAP